MFIFWNQGLGTGLKGKISPISIKFTGNEAVKQLYFTQNAVFIALWDMISRHAVMTLQFLTFISFFCILVQSCLIVGKVRLPKLSRRPVKAKMRFLGARP